MRLEDRHASACFQNHVLNHARDKRADSFVYTTPRVDARMLHINRIEKVADKRHSGNVAEREQIGAQAIVNVMRVVSNIIRKRRHLRFGARISPQFQVLNLRIRNNRRRSAMPDITPYGDPCTIHQRTVMFDQPFERFPTQVKAVERSVTALKICHDTQSLRIVIETAVTREALVQRPLASVSEWRGSKIMGKSQRFAEGFIQPPRPRQRSCGLGALYPLG